MTLGFIVSAILTRVETLVSSYSVNVENTFHFKCFPGANTKQLDYYSFPTIIHTGSNNTTKSVTVNPYELAKGIVNIGLKCKYYGVGRIAISSILARSNNLKEHQNMGFSVNYVSKIWLNWQWSKSKQSDNEKSHRKKVNESYCVKSVRSPSNSGPNAAKYGPE